MLSFTLDHGPVKTPRYHSDDPIALTVEAELYESCITLVAQLRWDAIGEHDPAHEVVEEVVLARDLPAMTTSQTFTHTFAAPGDGHPPSYDGETFQYVWRVVVIANQRGGEEREERVVHVDTRPAPLKEQPPPQAAGGWFSLVMGLCGMALGLLLLAGSIKKQDIGTAACAIVCGLIFPLPFLFDGIVGILAGRLIRDVSLDTEGQIGGDARCTLRFTPRRRCTLTEIKATLTGAERSSREVGSGKHRHHEVNERVCFTETCTLASGGVLPGGEEARFDGVFSLPDTLPPTLGELYRDPAVYWTLDVEIGLALWPDWKHKRQVLILPAERADARGGRAGDAW